MSFQPQKGDHLWLVKYVNQYLELLMIEHNVMHILLAATQKANHPINNERPCLRFTTARIPYSAKT